MFKKFLALSTVMGMVATAHATTITGPYVGGSGGYDLTQIQHGHFSDGSYATGADTARGAGSARIRHQNGYTGFVNAGWGFGNGLRAEIEGDYFYSQINHMNSNAAANRMGGGDRNYGALVNVLYDIDLKRLFNIDVPVTPYVGVGAGYLWNAERNVSANFANGNAMAMGNTNGSFAYQGIVGVAYDIPGVPGLALTADYRMVGQDFENGHHGVESITSTGEHSGHVSMDPRFNHQFNLGIRYAFNSAPPAPAPAPVQAVPAPVEARTYLVFFDWDSIALSGRAKEIVANAAQASTHIQTTTLEVNGYADSSAAQHNQRGEAYNQKLSVRRADAVKAELVRDGVPASAIDVRGYGDTHPLIPTVKYAREPQNRRVEIILR